MVEINSSDAGNFLNFLFWLSSSFLPGIKLTKKGSFFLKLYIVLILLYARKSKSFFSFIK